MTSFFLTLHMVSMCLVIGTMFLQSLSVVFRLRLKSPEEIAGVRKVQNRSAWKRRAMDLFKNPVAIVACHPRSIKWQTDQIRFSTQKICHDGAYRYFYNRRLDYLSSNNKAFLNHK